MENARPSSYYECTFCKRGFTNAQALGGHMNIHRKGKSKLIKPKSPNPNPNFPHLNCTSSAVPPRTLHDHQAHMNMYLSAIHIPPPPPPPPPMSCATRGPGGSGLYYSHMCYYSPLPTQLPCNPNYCPPGQLGFHGGDPGFNLKMQIGSSRTHGYDDREEEINEVQDGEDNDDDVLDLELRLGRPPRRQ